MKLPRFTRLLRGAFALSFLASSVGWAQLSVEKVQAINKTLQTTKVTYNRLDSRHQKMLDGYANIVHLAGVWEKHGMSLADPTFAPHARLATQESNLAPLSSGNVRVSNPASDVAFSSFSGFTQSETSTARCGDNVVVGFNDSGSLFETPFFVTNTGGESLAGYAYSSNGGASFIDGGPLNPGPGTGNILASDPVVTCSDAQTFYYSEIFQFSDAGGQNAFAAVSINKSNDGGRTWGDPVPAVAMDLTTHFLDKPWSAIDPSRHNRIFVSYTDFDNSGKICGFDPKTNPVPRTAIEFVESTDGGTSWRAPHVVIEACGNEGFQGSQIAVSSNGTMYISWVNLGNNFPFSMRAIQVSSFKGGVVSNPVTVAKVQPGGDSYLLQGNFRDFLDMAMAIDHSGTFSDGFLYISWADGRDKIVPDPLGTDGFYAYDDILLSRSLDGGRHWFGPIKVNRDTQPRLTRGRDHYQVGVAVDNRGVVGTCWYDRRQDPENFAIRRYCGTSSDRGSTFTESDIGMNPFAPTHDTDVILFPDYMGDYDQMSSDFLNLNSGFLGAFQQMGRRGNPNVWAHPMK